jgi:hypothetical protein
VIYYDATQDIPAQYTTNDGIDGFQFVSPVIGTVNISGDPNHPDQMAIFGNGGGKGLNYYGDGAGLTNLNYSQTNTLASDWSFGAQASGAIFTNSPLTVTCSTPGLYQITCTAYIDGSGGGGGYFRITNTVGAIVEGIAIAGNDSGSTFTSPYYISGWPSAVTHFPNAGNMGGTTFPEAYFSLTVQVGGANTFTLQCAQSTSNNAASILKAGSRLTALFIK